MVSLSLHLWGSHIRDGFLRNVYEARGPVSVGYELL